MKAMETQESTLEYYQKNARSLASRYEAARMEVLHARLEEILPTEGRILELGCGSGRDAAYLLGQGFDVEASDGSPAMLKAALRLHPELQGRLRRLSLPQGLTEIPSKSYQAVYSLALFMHLEEQLLPPIFTEIHRILEPRGTFFYSVPLSRPGMTKSGYDELGRFFLLKDEAWWQELAIRQGFKLQFSETTDDGLGREAVRWLNIQLEK